MEKKKYQVFVSSTYKDLVEERREVIQTLLEGDFIPAGMELFYASNDEQFEYIKKVIDNCDYYVLIIGGRYGSINPSTGISFTEQEYDYAIEKNIPVLAYIHPKPEKYFPRDVIDTENSDKLDSFRQKVQANRMCKEWSYSAQLVSGVNHGLNNIIESDPRPGWSRGENNSHLSAELKEKENQYSELKKKYDLLKVENKELLDDNQSLKNIKAKSPTPLSTTDEKLLKELEAKQYANFDDDSILVHGVARKNNETLDYQKHFKWEWILSRIVPHLAKIKGLDDFDRYLVVIINSSKEPLDPFLVSVDMETLKTIQERLSLTHALNFGH